MRKIFLGVFAVVISTLFLSSCLGDGNGTTYQGTRDFGVINISNGTKYAALGSGMGGIYVTWDGINTYNAGDAVLLTYKVDASNLVAGNNSIMIADYATVAEGESFTDANQKRVFIQEIDTVSNAKTAFFKGFQLNKFSSNTFFSDRWLVDYTAGRKDGDALSINFYYDETKQTLNNGAALPANTVIVDVVLTKSNTAPEGASIVTDSNKMLVVNMSGLRANIHPSTTASAVAIGIWFRLKKENTKVSSGYEWAYLQNAGTLLYDKTE